MRAADKEPNLHEVLAKFSLAEASLGFHAGKTSGQLRGKMQATRAHPAPAARSPLAIERVAQRPDQR